MTRGLCSKHYQQFAREKRQLDVKLAEKWEAWLIETGQILPDGKKQPRSKSNNFANLLAQFVSADDAAEIEKHTKEAKSESLKRQKKPNGNAKSG